MPQYCGCRGDFFGFLPCVPMMFHLVLIRFSKFPSCSPRHSQQHSDLFYMICPKFNLSFDELVQFQPMFWWIGSILTWLELKRGINNCLILNQRKGMNLKIINQQHQSTSCNWQHYITILNIRNSSFHHICSFMFKSLTFIQNVTYNQIL